jgi:SAM-dependent methyltransferase
MNGAAVWAHAQVPEVYSHLWQQLRKTRGCRPHWSRVFEYPWMLLHGDFRKGQRVLDAGGGEGPLQYYLAAQGCLVTNIDEAHAADQHHYDVVQLKRSISQGAYHEAYDRVACVSVLEHTSDPQQNLRALWLSVKKGGRLIVTLDVAGYARWNHGIDDNWVKEQFRWLQLEVPPEPDDILFAHFPEIERTRWEPEQVSLRVLCFWIDKPTE